MSKIFFSKKKLKNINHKKNQCIDQNINQKKKVKLNIYQIIIFYIILKKVIKINLLKKMIRRALISKHPLGGIKVDNQTFQVIGKDAKTNPNLFAIGELTKGECFLTTDLNITTVQAKKVTSIIVSHLVPKYSASE